MSIEVPPGYRERLDRLVADTAAELPDEPPEAVRRLVELSVLAKGIRAAERDREALTARADDLARTGR
jgi:hypothetical protein